MRTIFVIAALLQGIVLSGQTAVEFGVLTPFEREFETYEKDSTAHTVYLNERGDSYFEVQDRHIWLIKKYHAKKKILDQRGFSQAEVVIPYYHSDNRSERVTNLRAMTHNGTLRHSVMPEQVFEVDENEFWSMKKFTFPKVEVGSILEYTYEIRSPYIFNLRGWSFQDGIPKVLSEFHAKIPGNYKYNRTLIGELALDVDEATLEKSCFYLPGTSSNPADCEVLTYTMKDVPAFEHDGEYMLSANNYRSRLDFELSEYQGFDGTIQKFTKTWEDVDREFKADKDIGGQLRKKNYFEKRVPEDLLEGPGDALTRAEAIYSFVQDHYTWNQKFGIFRDNRVKQAFDAKVGNVAEINITLINLLNNAGIHTDLMLVSTREHGLPKTAHPVMSDFNYVVARTEIGGATYLLDATEKELPFGMLPYRCLNYYGRVMDMKKGSYWQEIHPEQKNGRTLRLQLELDEDKLVGSLEERSMGHDAFFKREHIRSLPRDRYLDRMEDGFDRDFTIVDYRVDLERSDDRLLVERFDFEADGLGAEGSVYFNPFLVRFFNSNPFKAETRNHPVDFGYPRSYYFMASIKVPEGYRLGELPKPVHLGLPDNSGSLRFNCTQSDGTVLLNFSLQMKFPQYSSAGYPFVKEIHEQAVLLQNKSYLVFERVE